MSHRVRVNPITCEAHGMCAELLPEKIVLDDWGYPLIDDEPLPDALLAHAKRAAAACPTFALLVERDRRAGRGSTDVPAGERVHATPAAHVRVSARQPRQPRQPR
jgi:ferredoxin